MATDDGRLVLSLVGFGGGIYTFFKGFRQFREYRVVADTPVMHIRGIPMGLVQIRGQALGEQTLSSPLSHTPCYLFKVVIEEWHYDSEGGGEWKHRATDVRSTKFYLQDASGNVLIDAAGAELDLPQTLSRKVGSGAAGGASRLKGGVAPASAKGANDTEILKYIEEVRVRYFGEMVGKGISLLSPGADREPSPQRQSLLSFLAEAHGPNGVSGVPHV